jgi:hypothetical protein
MINYVSDQELEKLKDILSGVGLEPQLIEAFIVDYQRYRYGGLARLSTLSSKFLSEIGSKRGREEMLKALTPPSKVINKLLSQYIRYIDYKTQIAQTYQETNSWYDVLSTHVYRDSSGANESFIDYVEEVYQTQLKDVKHLQELTGITELDTWDSKSGKYVDPKTEQESKENAIKELQDTLTTARANKYKRALESAIQGGATYTELLQIKPQDYGLPEKWLEYGSMEYDQARALQEVIASEYLLFSPGGLMLFPGLRAIAEDLQAPYSVILDSYNNEKH